MRTFLAIELPPEILKKLGEIQSIVKKDVCGVRWVKPENIHLTIRFLGEITEQKASQVRRYLPEWVSNLTRFSLTLSRIGAFPGLGNPRVLWVGLKAPEPSYFNLVKSVQKGLTSLGFPAERKKHVPHLTLARFNKGRFRGSLIGVPERIGTLDSTFQVSGITFFKSELTPRGPIYTRLSAVDFPEEEDKDGKKNSSG